MQQLTIPVANVATLLSDGFTTIEVWTAADYGEPFSEVTSTAVAPATLVSSEASTTFDMGGRTLIVNINGGPRQVISFDPLLRYWTPAQVATRINEVVPGLATATTEVLTLTSPTTGRSSTLYVEYSDSPNLGFYAGQTARGLAARIPLVDGTVLYPFTDVGAVSTTRFKWRFSADGIEPLSEYVDSQYGLGPLAPGVAVSVAYAQFADAAGRPLKRTVIIAQDQPPSVSGGTSIGAFGAIEVSSDDNGFFQYPLIQGLKVRVAIEGTAFVRQITVPATASFELMSALAAAQDPFSPQSVPPLLIRQSQ